MRSSFYLLCLQSLLLQNIPNKMKDYEVMEFIDEASSPLRSFPVARTHFARPQVVGRSYDFFYLRCDYSNGCNVGCKLLVASVAGEPAEYSPLPAQTASSTSLRRRRSSSSPRLVSARGGTSAGRTSSA